jgi:hypothetical protein
MTTIKLKLEKSTKNTFRYTEIPAEGQPEIIGTLYIQKWFLGSNPPEQIKVTIEKEA